MSLYLCEICDNLRDSDYVEIVEYGNGLACLDCMPEEYVNQMLDGEEE